MRSVRLSRSALRVNEPLPWDVFDANGTLLLRRGFRVQMPDQLDHLVARGAYVQDYVDAPSPTGIGPARPQAPRPPIADPVGGWQRTESRLANLLHAFERTPDVAERLTDLAPMVTQLCDRDPDLALFQMIRWRGTNYGVAHAIHAATVCELITRRLGWPASQRMTLLRAALSMNVGMRQLQSSLVSQTAPLSDPQRELISQHPVRGLHMLERVGVDDDDWLRAVALHHESPDRMPVRVRHGSAAQLAEVIRLADIFGAKVSPRASRPALSPDQALRETFMSHGGTDNPLVAALVREMGIYPPGTGVRLASGELGLVIRRGERANQPVVYAVINRNGQFYMEPVVRDTARAQFAVTGTVPAERFSQLMLDPARVFGYEPRRRSRPFDTLEFEF
ncbi:hypothetical protein GCM10025771_10800 [Niveibacterium umoris]|uniref:HD-GYP domain-containing protein n=1 Tax=Niveibacterium umoris TaxID=1193620 RepID=A0A840BPH3_9RHOO|nr:HD domain-containing phosphohydrolase [Niveibacterium umoris]MBB4013369.1 hypothetical protein [Niveibacterium umoris]